MKDITLLNQNYKLVKDVKDGFQYEEIEKIITDYFLAFDYILGDWSYGKLRLKGFNMPTNPNFKAINDYSKIAFYLKNFCAYDCKYFILEKK